MPAPQLYNMAGLQINDRQQFRQQWAAERPTLIDYAILAGNDIAELVDESAGSFPEIQLFGTRPIDGTMFKQLVRTAKPSVGFRNANEGTDATKGQYAERQFNCHILNPRWEADAALVDGAPNGQGEEHMAEEAVAMVEAAFETIGRQTYYGTTGNDAKGFAGFLDIVDPNLVVDATGTTDGEKSSVWAVRLTRNQVQYLLGNGGSLNVSEPRLQDVIKDGKPMEAYVQSMLAHIGFKVSDLRAVGRVKNCTKQAGKSIDGNLMAELIAKFPTNQPPTHVLMNSTQREQYRQALITTENPEPRLPTEIQGIPIIPTDSIVNGHAREIAG